jgi:PAS domain S-box-containing protein
MTEHRSSESDYQVLFTKMEQGFCIIEKVATAPGEPSDFRYITTNPAFERHTGLRNAVGKTIRELVPGAEDAIMDRYDEVAATGVAQRFEANVAALDLWMEAEAFATGAPNQVAVLFSNVSARKRIEITLRESEERQAFLLKLSDALRPLGDPATIEREACRLIGERLAVDNAHYVKINEAEGWARVAQDYVRGDRPSLAGDYSLSDFGWIVPLSRTGRATAITDARTSSLLSVSEQAAMDAIRVAGIAVAPLVKDRLWVGALVITQLEPREWTPFETGLLEETGERIWASIERAEAQEALRTNEEQLRLIVESARDYAIFTTDQDGVIDKWLPGAESVFGWTKAEAESQSGEIVFTPEDRERGEATWELATARRDGKAPDVRWHLHKDGHRVFIEGEVVPLRGAGRTVTGFLKIGRDATQRRAAEDALRLSEERFRQFGEASSDILWMRDPETMRWTYLTPAFEDVYGLSRDEALAGDNFANWVELILPEDRPDALDSIARVRGGERVQFEYRIRRPADGEIRWLRDTDFAMLDEHGEVRMFGGIGQDITALKRAEQHQRVLLAELQHRVRNTLAIVRSIARRTAENSTNVDDMLAHFQGRLDAFSRVQAALTRSPDARVDLTSLIEDELVAHATREGSQLRLLGPDIALEPKTAERLSLAIHELATNAVKHGALINDKGRIEISWNRVSGGDGDALILEWVESGVEIDGDGVRDDGFGMELLRRSLPYDVQGETAVDLHPTGLRFELTMPLKADGDGV